MSGRLLGSTLVLLALAWPLATIVYASKPQNCCFGTTCPTIQGCTYQIFDTGPTQCKRTCSSSDPPCTEGNGCCQYRIKECRYSGGLGCDDHNGTIVTEVTFYDNKYCRNGADQVACLHTADNTCNQ